MSHPTPASRRRAWAGRLLTCAGFATALVAAFHALAIVVPSISEPSPPWRHGLFVAVNALFAWAFCVRTWWLPVPFGVLWVQQTWSHGTSFLEARAAGHLDLQSAAVLCAMPALALLVLWGRRPRATVDPSGDGTHARPEDRKDPEPR